LSLVNTSVMAKFLLFHCVGARSLRTLWTLKELGLHYELITMPFPPRAQPFRKEWKEINPLGTVPFFVDVEENARMTESSGTAFYLAERFDREDRRVSFSPEDAEFAKFINLLFQSDAVFTFPLTLRLRYKVFEPHRMLQEVGEDYTKWFLTRLKNVDAILQSDGTPFLCGEKFTIADICVSFGIWLAKENGLDEHLASETKEYLNRVTSRKAFQECLVEEKISLKNFNASLLKI